jgi:hypothetical protein
MTDEEQFAEWMRRRYSDGPTDRDMVAYGAARAPLLARIADLEKLSDAISRDCNNTALERNEWHSKAERLRAQVERLEVAARQASFCLRELLPNDPDAKFTVKMLSDAIKPKTSR